MRRVMQKPTVLSCTAQGVRIRSTLQDIDYWLVAGLAPWLQHPLLSHQFLAVLVAAECCSPAAFTYVKECVVL